MHATPTKWAGVAAARTQKGLLAAWSGETLVVSRDGGSRFEPVSEGGGTIGRAVFGDDGKLFATRGSHTLVVVDGKGHVIVRGLDFARSTSEIAAGAGALA
ncbi:MAG TPA: hypothetical protein VFF43_22040, partial [Caldimonas sp.]|nr:hypothetical protein [Caldimonas sp.]